ncbi:MAG: lipid-A-disaccharide synthase [Elusimicrobia bacterium RIFOXYD2_FULL_34_15]|nr:MAG: lipid-A-disaccharide synthase [Elusimicrobia bacterium RIFOXYD2_FULL_34_15]
MKIFISAGDPSGDLHGSNLIKEIKLQSPATQIFGFGGSKMASSAVIFDKIADKSILGFWEPIKNIPRLKNNFSIAKNFFSKEKPDIFIPIDYYGFNIHLVKEAHRQNIPIIYFISPQVWATRRGRIKELKKYVKKILVIYPFEEAIYDKEGIDCGFVGNPLLDIIPQGLIHKSNEFKTIGIMPGSRIQEIKNHFHIFVEAFKIINKTFKDSKVIIPVFSDDVREYIRKNFFLDFNKVEFVQYNDYEKRAKMDICITSSGTATVENMILGVPMVIVYKTSFITYHIAKLLINIPYIGMVNILSGKMICPELIQYEATPKNIAEKCLEILKSKVIYQKIQNELAETKKLLGSPGATKRAANIILRDSNG